MIRFPTDGQPKRLRLWSKVRDSEMMDFNFRPAPRLSEIVRRIRPALVHIATPTGSGSGFVITPGHIITNAHVVETYAAVTVEFVDGTTTVGSVLGRDATADLACIQVYSQNALAPLPMGDSDQEQVGEDVIAMGYPLGDILRGEPTVTRGIISAKRTHDGVEQLQTDAALNSGNSGGPLVNAYGSVIGVITWQFRNSEGISFAVPMSVVKDRLDFLISGGEARKFADPASEPVESEWITHHVGSGGFSIELPYQWTQHPTGDGIAYFYSGDSRFSIVMLDIDFALDKEEFTTTLVGRFMDEVAEWHQGEIVSISEDGLENASAIRQYWGRLQRRIGFSEDSQDDERTLSVNYRGDKLDERGIIKGRKLYSWLQSGTESSHLRLVTFETPEGSAEDQYGIEKIVEAFLSTFQKWDTYWSGRYQWSLSAAPDWHPEEYSDRRLTLLPSQRDAFLIVRILDLDDEVPVEELCKQVVMDHLGREDAWNSYQIISAHEDDYGEHDWYRINYRYLGKDDISSQFCIRQVGRSDILEYIATAIVDETILGYYAADLDNMLDSFRFRFDLP